MDARRHLRVIQLVNFHIRRAQSEMGSSPNAKSVPQDMSRSAFPLNLTAACHYKIRMMMMLFWSCRHRVSEGLVDCTKHQRYARRQRSSLPGQKVLDLE